LVSVAWTTTADRFAEGHPGLQHLARTDGIGEQDRGTQRLRVESLADGRVLVVQRIGQHVVRNGESVVDDRNTRLAECRLQHSGDIRYPGGVPDDTSDRPWTVTSVPS